MAQIGTCMPHAFVWRSHGLLEKASHESLQAWQIWQMQERNDDRIAAQDLHELGFLAGIFDGHRGKSSQVQDVVVTLGTRLKSSSRWILC